MAKQTNGAGTQLQQITHEARMKIMRHVRKHGSISSGEASELSGYSQVYYHLVRLARAGLLEHAGYNRWVAKRKPAYASGERSTKAVARMRAGPG